MLNRTFYLCFILIAVVGCSKSPDQKAQPQPVAKKQKVVLEMGDYQLSDAEVKQILRQMSIEQKVHYLGRGEKGMEEFINDVAERHLLAQAARDRKMTEAPEVQAGMIMASDAVLYQAFYKKEILDKVVPESEIRAFYDKNKERLTLPEQVRIRQIFVSPRAEAEIKNSEGNDAKTEEQAKQKIDQIVSELKKGADFAEVAKRLSEDPSAPNGGEMPWFGKGRMVQTFEEAAFKLSPGQSSEPFKTEFGYYILQLQEKRSKTEIPYEQVRDQIQNQIASSRQDMIQKLYQKILDDLKTKYPKKVHLENLSH
ncbi:MAG TPA: peptidylprolyl isomerase [Acidobacteriota bacterium]|nr:peptidylprolyl isomerase [Acidobacteriota bacterium]